MLCVHHLHGNVGSVRRYLHGRIPVRDADSVCLYSHSRLVSCQARRHGHVFAESRTRAVDAVSGRRHCGRYHYVFRLYAGRRGNVAARICREEPEGGKRRLVPRNVRLWTDDSSGVVHGRGRASARSGGKDCRLRLDRRSGSGAGNRNSAGGTHGSGAGRHFVRHHVDGGQLPDCLRADLRPRYL